LKTVAVDQPRLIAGSIDDLQAQPGRLYTFGRKFLKKITGWRDDV
jgi:hypothetical protein